MKPRLDPKDFKLEYVDETPTECGKVNLEYYGVVIASFYDDGTMRSWEGDFWDIVNGGY